MKYKIAAFFADRNGFDELSKVMMWGGLILMLVSGFIPVQWLSAAAYGVSVAGVGYAYFRVFSKKLEQRQAENNAFLTWKNQLKQRWTQRKTHRFFRCRKCRTMLRVPKGKGKISIRCRCCGETFIRKT